MKQKVKILVVIIIILLLLLTLRFHPKWNSGLIYNDTTNYSHVTLVHDKEAEILSDELSIENYMKALEFYDIKDSKLVLAQAILETGYFKSYNCRVRNNTLGLVNSRKMEYFAFDHWSESILGYKEMVEYKKKKDENHYEFLIRIGYAEDPEYISKLKTIVLRLDDDIAHQLLTHNTNNDCK